MELLAQKMRSVPDEELGHYRMLCPELWREELGRRYPGTTVEDERKAREAAVLQAAPQPQPPADVVTRAQLKIIIRNIARGTRNGFINVLRDQLPQALAGGDKGGKLCEALVAVFKPIIDRLDSLEAKLHAMESNQRRAIGGGSYERTN
jgi:hypothetical protein